MLRGSVVSGYQISTSFRRLKFGQRIPRFWGITSCPRDSLLTSYATEDSLYNISPIAEIP